MLFELNPEKIQIGLTITHNGKPFRVVHELRRAEEEDWIIYDKGLSIALEDAEETGSVRHMDDSLSSACKFWDAINKSISGYLPDGQSLPPNYRELVPPEHKRAAVQILLLVAASQESFGREGLLLISDEEVIRLRVKRETEFPNLVHRFKPAGPKSGSSIAASWPIPTRSGAGNQVKKK